MLCNIASMFIYLVNVLQYCVRASIRSVGETQEICFPNFMQESRFDHTHAIKLNQSTWETHFVLKSISK